MTKVSVNISAIVVPNCGNFIGSCGNGGPVKS